MIKKIKRLLERDKAKGIINERGFMFCPTCGMALKFKVKEETFCPFCAQRLNRDAPSETPEK